MRTLISLAAWLFCVPPFAATPAPLETVSLSGVSGPHDTPAQAFSHARYNLRAGTQYARAVRQLQFCTARDPGNRAYHLALGCAFADRAASAGYSAMWTKMLADERAKYPQAMKEWQVAQQDPKDDSYGDPRPDPPPDKSFPTKDDGKAFTLTPAQATAQVNALSQSAQAEWKQGVALSLTPAERADAEWTQGCGLHLLRLTGSSTDGEFDLPAGGASLPTTQDVVNALSAATHDAPQNAVYWQSLGDALHVTGSEKSNLPALAAYQKSLALEPKNAPLWFRVYRCAFPLGSTFRKPEQAKNALRHVIDSDPGNAYPHYLLAALLFRRTRFSDINGNGPEGVAPALAAVYDAAQYKDADTALTQMEAGNAAPRYAVPEYVSPCPELLTGFAIWRPTLRFTENGFGEMAHLRELARAASGYGRICAAHGDRAGLERGARAALGMGTQMAGDWPLRDSVNGGTEVITALVGFAVTGIGYSSLVKGYAQLGDDPASQAAQAEWDKFKARQQTWKQILMPILSSQSLYDDY